MNNQKISRLFLSLLFLAVFFLPTVIAHAEQTIGTTYIVGSDPNTGIATGASLGYKGFVDKAVNIGLFAAGAVGTIFLIYGSISYMTSGGDDAKSTNARKMIINAFIGIVLASLTFVILRTAANTGHLISGLDTETVKNP